MSANNEPELSTPTTTASPGLVKKSSQQPKMSSKFSSANRQIVIVDDDWPEHRSASTSVISTSTSSLNSTSTSASGNPNSSSSVTQSSSISSSDPLLVKSLVCDFFESQFSLKGESCQLHPHVPELDDSSISVNKSSRDFQEVAAALRELGQQYVRLYEDRIQMIIDDFQKKVERENVAQSFEYLSSEFFLDGISWHYILTYFVFSAEIAQYASRSGLASVDDVAGWLISYIDAHLSSWIKQNGGWIGFRKFFVEKGFLTNDNSKIESNTGDSSTFPLVFGTAAAAVSLGCYLKKFWNRP